MKHLFYQNFCDLITNRPKNIGWHWRGEAVLTAPKNLKNCPFPLRQLFKDIHSQLLQWYAVVPSSDLKKDEENSISGEMYLLDIDTFDTPIKEITSAIAGKNRTGKLYDWVENGVFEEIDYPSVGIYIFIDNADTNFCHLVLKNDTYYIPTAFDINDFLLLLAHTRGLQGLYSCLGRGVTAPFLNDLLVLEEVFEEVGIDFCIQKLYEQHCKLNPTKAIAASESAQISIFCSHTHLTINLNPQIIHLATDTNYLLALLSELYKSLIHIENNHADDFFDYSFKAWQSYASLSYQDIIFSVSHTEKHLIVLQKIDLIHPQNNLEDFCDAISFYKAFLVCTNEFITKETDVVLKKSLTWHAKKLYTMLRFLYVGHF